MTDPQSQLIGLLERLSVVAPERCEIRYADYFGALGIYPIYYLFLSGRKIKIADGPGDYSPFDLIGPEAIILAVLEEADSRKMDWQHMGGEWRLEWATGYQDVHVHMHQMGILEREVLPRLSCLVLALESQQ